MKSTPKLSIAIGSVLNISSRSGHRLNARVLGMFEGGSIIAHIPGAIYTDLVEGDEVAVRYLAGRTAYGFKTTVLRRCTSPYPYFHLAYPDSVQDVEVRGSERISCLIPALVKSSAGAQTEVEIRDLSCSGALLVSADSFGVTGDAVQLTVELSLGQIKPSLELSATIRNVQIANGAQADQHRSGVLFEALAETDQILLLAVVYERLAATVGVGSGAAMPADNASEQTTEA
jgi:c-di-GMP-binding flagellar brake protein YcgR